MPKFLILRLFLVLALGAGLFGAIGGTRSAAASDLLQNPSFEGDYAAFEGDVSRLVAPGWSAWNVQRKAGEPSWSNIQPQYLPTERAGRVKSGVRAQEFYELYSIYTAGVFQQVKVGQGAKVTFSAFVSFWSTDLLDQPTPGGTESEKPGQVSAQVGIDPKGGTNGESPDIVWGSSEANYYDQFRKVSVETTAVTETVTVFVRVIILDPVRRNHTYVDDAELTAEGGAVSTPVVTTPPEASATPTPTLTLTTQPPTAVPPSSTPTFTPTTGGVIVPTREGTFVPVTPSTEQPTSIPPSPSNTPDLTGVDLSGLPGRIQYVVQAGDTVSGIAARFQSRVDAIIALNGLPPSGLIIVGKTLTIPVPQQPSATPTLTPTATNTLPVVVPTQQTGGGAPVEVATLNGPVVNGIGTYIMQPGDTLEAVARRFNTTVQYLINLNGIVNPARLVIGQVLAVPGPGNNPPGGTRAPTVVPTQPGGGDTGQPGRPARHVVQAGENLFRISLRYNVTMDAIMRANGIVNPNLIFVGQVLVIP